MNRIPPIRKLFTDISDNERSGEQEDIPESDTFRVFLRIKPSFEMNNSTDCIKIVDGNKLVCKPPVTSKSKKAEKAEYIFSHIFGPRTTQHELFLDCVAQCVEDLLLGRDSLIFAYGTTNAGKTFTVQGSPKHPGMIPETLHTLFSNIVVNQGIRYKPYLARDILKLNPDTRQEEAQMTTKILALQNDQSKSSKSTAFSESSHFMHMLEKNVVELRGSGVLCSVWISFLEVYNETIYDLLDFVPSSRKPLKLSEDKNKNFYVKGLKQVNVHSAAEAFTIYQFGKKNLNVASTKLNDRSSRSHCIFTIHVVNLQDPQQPSVSKLRICDLAGTERQTKANNSGLRLKESGNINGSLFQLNQCLRAIKENQINTNQVLIPYRHSNLTKLFQSALDGKSDEKIVMVVNINPAPNLYDETKQVLKMCAITSKIKNKPICDRMMIQSSRFSTFIYGRETGLSNDSDQDDDYSDYDEDLSEGSVDPREVQELKEKLARQSEEIEKLKQHVDIHKNSRDVLKKHLEGLEVIYNNRIQGLNDRLKSQKEFFKGKLDEVRSSTILENCVEDDVKQELLRKDALIEDLESKIHKLELKEHRKSAPLEIPSDVLLEKEAKIKELESLLEEAKNEYIVLSKQWKTEFKKLSEVEDKLNEKIEANEALEENLNMKVKIIEELELKVESLEETLSNNTYDHERVLTHLETERDDAKAKWNQAKQNIDDLNSLVTKLKQTIQDSEDVISQLQKEKNDLRIELETARENERVKNEFQEQGRRYNTRKQNARTPGKENKFLSKLTPFDSIKKQQKGRCKEKVPLGELDLNDSLEASIFRNIPEKERFAESPRDVTLTGKKKLYSGSPLTIDLTSDSKDKDCSFIPDLNSQTFLMATPAETVKSVKKNKKFN